MKKKHLRRSLLFVPASSQKMIRKAVNVPADAIILDLEDAVSPDEKQSARGNITDAISVLRPSGKEIIVRVNAIDTAWGINDLLQLATARPDTVMVPKANQNNIVVADMILGAMESDESNPIGIIALVETPTGLLDINSILVASNRINGVLLGAEDLTREMGIERTESGEEITYARSVLTMSAAAHKVSMIDTPFTDIKNLEGLAADTTRAKALGCSGKACIHPSHIECINASFTPDESSIAQAKEVVEAYELACKEGKGACMFNGKMLDLPVVERAKNLLAISESL